MSPWTVSAARTAANTILLVLGFHALLSVHGEYNNNSSQPVPVKPEIERISDVTSKAGEVAVFTCRVFGYPDPVVQWSRRDHQGPVVLPGNNTRMSTDGNGTLTIRNVTLSDAGTYYCAGENEYGFDRTSAELVVLAKPEFTVLPSDMMVGVGESVALRCEVSGNPKPTVFWSRGTGKHLVFPSQDHGRFTVTKNGTLHIESVETADSGVYLCQAINFHGSAEAAATVTVTEAPVITNGPESRNVTEGTDVTLTCRSTGSPRPMVVWLRNGRTVMPTGQKIALSNDGSIRISDIKPSNGGKFTCRVFNVAGEATRSAQITVHELKIPPTILTAAENRTLTVGDELELSCEVTGSPRPFVRWFRDEQPMEFKDPRLTLYANGGRLKISDTVVLDSGNYTCQAYNIAGKTGQNFLIKIEELPVPPTILTHPQHQNLTDGDRLELWCQASGTPRPVVAWYRDGKLLRFQDSRSSITDDGLLFISSVLVSDSGTYTCKVSNVAGEAFQSSTVKIQALHLPPEILAGPQNVNLTLGARLELSCQATGTPRPIVAWLRDSRPIVLTDPRVTVTVNGSLVISDIRALDTGVYTCRVSNIAGEASQNANISVEEARCGCVPAPADGEVTVYGIKPGDIARFACDPGFSLIGQEYISCDTTGQWTASPPVCREGVSAAGVPFATCAITARDRHTLFYRNYQRLSSDVTSRFPHGTELQARCSHIGKYTFHGSHNLICEHGHWTEPVPYCSINGLTTGNFTPEVDFRVERGQYLITPDGRLAVRPGSKVILICRYNSTADWFLYWVNEHRNSYPTKESDATTLELTIEKITQSDGGKFSCLNVEKVGKTTITITVEDWTCPASVLTSQNIVLVEEDNKLGGRAVFRCADGYTMQGSDTSRCMIGGKWHPPSPVCKGTVVCSCFEMTPNLVARIQRNERAYNAYFSCVPGFELRGKADITCNPNGTWSDPVPDCEEIDCGMPPGFNHGRLVGNVTTLGGVYYFWCDSGFIPEGSSHFTRCQADGKWSHEAPSCLEVHCNQTERDCFPLRCSDKKQYLVPRDQINRHWGCCGDSLYDMRKSVCDTDNSPLPCSKGHPCNNGNCVSTNEVCDGINQCSDGTDERGCGSCDASQFRCRGGQCIDINNVCNREKNCHDGSDEAGCARGLAPIGADEMAWCGRDEFTCPGDRACIPLSQICDGQYDCDGGYDEERCGANHCNPRVETCRTVACPDGELAFIPVRTRYVEWGCCARALYSRKVTFCSAHGVYPCPVVSFRCRNGNCVPPRWQCDSENDCSDGSDEAGCHGCPAEEYNCGDRQCIHISQVCDKVKHCYNGMDECHCARSDGLWCGAKQYRCANDNCIPRVKVCNHIDDCGDKSDEVKCFPHE